MDQSLNLNIQLTQPPSDSPPDVLATMTLHSDSQGLLLTGEVLKDPFSAEEVENLRWYLEEYWQWPYEQFRERAQEVENLLPLLGKRLYQAVFKSPDAQSLLQAWRLQPGGQRQVSIVSDFPRVLSLPWELLHDEQGFLDLRARHPVAIVRRLHQKELPVLPTPFEPPLRILLVTARPDDAGFVDPRSIARELLEEVSEHVEAGTMALEFLRPPTLPALRERLSDPKRPPVHVLHFDGHGAFGPEQVPQDGLRFESSGQQQGMLAFENEEGKGQFVTAGELAQVLQDSGVRLAVFNACQSAVGTMDDVLSSVATRLIQGGVDAVVAMSASVLVASATRFVEAFYRALAAGVAVPLAQERARQALHDDPRRHLTHRYQEDEGEPVKLRDWWLPHYYQQRPLLFKPTPTAPLPPARTRKKPPVDVSLPVFSEDMPGEPRYGFSGRALELLQIERALLQKKLVVIHGFGGMGKTALAREAADWFTRTALYQRAYFASFEQGGDATSLLSTLGTFLGIYDAYYHPNDTRDALAKIQRALKKQRLLVIADNLESILPKGEAALEPAERTQLWQVLLELRKLGAGMLLTTRDTSLGDGRLAPGKQVLHLALQGLFPEDAYLLASELLTALGIDRARAPYRDLRSFLAQLDHHPLAIQLVLPALHDRSLASIRTEFAQLLPTFVDDDTTGRNRSLLASLDYSLRRLSEEQRAHLSRLAVFEGGASEDNLLSITEIPAAAWATLRPALEQAALLTAEQVHEAIRFPFLHFHPVLVPFLRHQAGANEDAELRQRYAKRYYDLAIYLDDQVFQHPQPVYALTRRELPNLRRALEVLLYEGEVDVASRMAARIATFLTIFGMTRERDQLRQRVENAVAAAHAATDGTLTYAEYLRESGRAADERSRGNLRAAFAWLTTLLARIQAQPPGTDVGPGSFEHSRTLQELGYCLKDAGQLNTAEEKLRKALAVSDALLKQEPEETAIIRQRANVLHVLATALTEQGKYAQAQEMYEQALQEHRAAQDTRNEATTLGSLGILARRQRDYAQARSRFLQALDQFRALGEPREQAIAWYNLGRVAEEQQDWAEAERCYRESLALDEQLGNIVGAAQTCNALAVVARRAGRPGEAEGWYQGALERTARVEPGSRDHAMYLSNLANLLVSEVKAGRTDRTRLVEARRYAEQALRIKEQPGVSAEIWTTFSILAQIAELEEQPEKARGYHRRERETFAAFPGNRYRIDQQHADLIADIAAAARGDAQARAEVEAVLRQLEDDGWKIGTAVQRIWAGERDWQVLAEDLDSQDALLILRVLETLGAQSDA